jgi:hypothetical protein
MSVQHLKVIGLVVTILALIGGLGFAVHAKADPLVIGGLATAIGAGTTAAFRWFTGGDSNKDGGKAGPAAVFLVAGTILAAGDGCVPAQTPREQARSIVLTVAEGVRVGDEACASIAKAKRDVSLAEGCAIVVAEARSALLVAEAGVDAWNAANEGKLPCAVSAASSALGRILDTITRAGGRAPPAVADALKLAPLLTGACRG